MAMETTEGRESGLSTWAGPYVTDMLGRAEALAQLPFQQYKGDLTAPASALQSKAFQGIGGLTVPTGITQAGETLGNLATTGTQAYTPGTFTSQYQAPAEYQAGTFTNQFTAPEAYQAATFEPTAYSQQAIQPYMNPYLESVLEPQRREATRQADIARQAMQGRMAQAGAYGGSRQAIMEAEANRNLQTLLGDITGKGYASAFDTAQQQFANEQARRLQAAQLGEQSRQFGAGQAMNAAQLQAQFGLSAQQAQEASRQFAAQQAAQAAQQAAQYKTEAQRMAEQSRQYGANLGLQNLQAKIQAAQAQAQAGGLQAQYGLANLQEMARQGATQRDIEQQKLTADYNQFLREEAYPQQRLEFQRQMLTGLPIASASFYQPAPSAFQSAAGGALTAAQLLKILGQIS